MESQEPIQIRVITGLSDLADEFADVFEPVQFGIPRVVTCAQSSADAYWCLVAVVQTIRELR